MKRRYHYHIIVLFPTIQFDWWWSSYWKNWLFVSGGIHRLIRVHHEKSFTLTRVLIWIEIIIIFPKRCLYHFQLHSLLATVCYRYSVVCDPKQKNGPILYFSYCYKILKTISFINHFRCIVDTSCYCCCDRKHKITTSTILYYYMDMTFNGKLSSRIWRCVVRRVLRCSARVGGREMGE